MKTLRFILLAILLGVNLVSCEPPTIQDEIGVEEVESKVSLTEEESGTVDTENEERDN
ncbi:hypothetical protein [uncultured Aquimarina sp.]|uniref:hypothetical protein n=1 Tax=uncultured Aquimarina sp. TaxID=575652 RepID=UPI0026392AC5|nr:hypothetical protein [uncultured Aquimarina sp.]